MVENWTEITGKIISIMPEPTLENYHRINVKVDSKRAHGDFPDLLKLSPANEVVIQLESSIATILQLKAGNKISGLVRAEGLGRYFFQHDHIKIVP